MTPPRTAANADSMRRQNLAAVLEIIHHRRTLSRTEITRASGLSRSAVKGLVDELASLGLCFESEPLANNRSGRPSPMVQPNPNVLSVAVIRDASGITVAFTSLGARIVLRRVVPLPRDVSARDTAEIVARTIAESRDELPTGAVLVGIGVATPGFVTGDNHEFVSASSLGWDSEPFAQYLTEATGIPAETRYDGHLGVVAESIWGAGRGRSNVVYFYGGPGGIGTAVMVGGRLLRGNTGVAASFAHATVNPGGGRCWCGARGCFQVEVTQYDTLRALGEIGALPELPPEAAEDRSPRTVYAPPHDDDPVLPAPPFSPHERIASQLALTGAALRSAVIAYDPELILFGGFFSHLLAYGADTLAEYCVISSFDTMRQQVELGTPELGPDLLLFGAADLGFRQLLADPLSIVAA
ncbi:ROK family transcriptional regulator [Mycetocola tolaasinivorans]|uniref:ROK family transcriptional regulator n=1 Tax=Mycetocola tolaasinivorans TaxID=76635 RepID=A0A3L7AAM3_9MICO|nr:ROK family transcriptional regulator [Mycetocola tolaasinivorans]RLP77429.1 ROK family transcriptional regulator [Mycetocola tolaasinivorans]